MECENFISNVWNGCGGLDEAWLEEHANEIEESKREYDEARRMAAEFVADDEGDDGEEYNYVHRTPMMKATKKLINDTMKEVLTYEFLEWDLSTSEMLVTIFTYDHVQAVLEEFEPMPGFPSMLLETVEHWRLRISEITRYGYKHYPRERADHDDFRLRAYGVQAVLVEYMCVCLLKKASFFADEAKVARASKSVCDTIREEQEQYERNGVQGICTRSFALQRLRWLTEECALPGWASMEEQESDTDDVEKQKEDKQETTATNTPGRQSLGLNLLDKSEAAKDAFFEEAARLIGLERSTDESEDEKVLKGLEAFLLGGEYEGGKLKVQQSKLVVFLTALTGTPELPVGYCAHAQVYEIASDWFIQLNGLELNKKSMHSTASKMRGTKEADGIRQFFKEHLRRQ